MVKGEPLTYLIVVRVVARTTGKTGREVDDVITATHRLIVLRGTVTVLVTWEVEVLFCFWRWSETERLSKAADDGTDLELKGRGVQLKKIGFNQ